MAKTALISQVEPSSENEKIEKRIDVLVNNITKKLENKHNRVSRSLAECIENAPVVTDEMVEVLFKHNHKNSISQQALSEVQRSLKGMQRIINQFPAEERLFILESVDLFNSKLGLGKLIPVLLVLKGENQAKAICKLIFAIYFRLKKNIEKLLSDKRLFSSQQLYSERGTLYSFLDDITNHLIPLFKEDFVNRNVKNLTQKELLTKSFNYPSFLTKHSVVSSHKYIFPEIIFDEHERRKTVFRFLTAVQSHPALYMYSLKRHLFYKLFLFDLTKRNRFRGVGSFEVSRILAACMMAGEQIVPDKQMISSMLDFKDFNKGATKKAQKEYFEELSPKQLYKLISHFRYCLKHIYKRSFGKEFFEIQNLSVKDTLKNIWETFVDVVENCIQILMDIPQTVVIVFQQVRTIYDSLVSVEKKEEEEIKATISNRQKKGVFAAGHFNSKNIESYIILRQHFAMVSTNVIAFRGERKGAEQRDYKKNLQIFDNNLRLSRCFLVCFRKFFLGIPYNENIRTIEFKNQAGIREYYASYVFSRYMLCFGITHLKRPDSQLIEEKSLFPYLFLLKEGNRKMHKNIQSRTAMVDDELKLYNEVELNDHNLAFIYEALYLILHSLSDKEWGLKSVQICIDFLLNKLLIHQQKTGMLLYTSSLPEQIA